MGKTHIRQVNTLTDLITTWRGTEKEEESFSRRRQLGQIDLKLEAGKGCNGTVELRTERDLRRQRGRKSIPGRQKGMFEVSVRGRNMVVPESQLPKCKGFHYSKNKNSFHSSNIGLKPGSMC